MATTQAIQGRTRIHVAIILTIVSQLMFNFVFVCLKASRKIEVSAGAGTAAGIGIFEFLGLRSLMTIVLFTILLRRHRSGGQANHTARLRLVTRGLLGAAALLLIAYGSMRVPIAVMNLFNNASIFLVFPLAAMLFGERLSGWKFVASVAGFAGVLLILRDGVRVSLDRSTLEGYVAGVLFLLTSAAIRINVRKLEGINPALVMLWIGGVGLLTAAVALAIRGVTLPRHNMTWLLLLGAVGFEMAAQYTATIAGQTGPVVVVTLVTYSGLLFAVLSDVLIFHSPLTWTQAAGGGLVVSAAIIAPLIAAWHARAAQ